MIKLSPRLQMAADMVRPGSAVADIGTDHAFLPSFLVISGVSPRAVASDLRRGPLQNAKETLERYSIEDKVILRLSDGFDEILPGDAEDFIICGMGGTLMTQLLEKTEWLKDKSKRIILQPQSHSEDVRRFFAENGFSIIAEAACSDGGKLYNAMCAEYTGEIRQCSPGSCYVGMLPECASPEAMMIVKKTYARLQTRLNALCGEDNEETRMLHKAVEEIKGIIGETK